MRALFAVIPLWVYAAGFAVVAGIIGLQHWRIGQLRDEAVIMEENLKASKAVIDGLQLAARLSDAAQLAEIKAGKIRTKRKAEINEAIDLSDDDGHAGPVVRDTLLRLYGEAAPGAGGDKAAAGAAALR